MVLEDCFFLKIHFAFFEQPLSKTGGCCLHLACEGWRTDALRGVGRGAGKILFPARFSRFTQVLKTAWSADLYR